MFLGWIKLRLNKKIYLGLPVVVIVFIFLSIQIYAQGGPAQGVAIPAKSSNDTVYYWLPVVPNNQTQSNETAQSTTTNATIRPREGINATLPPTAPTTPVAPTTATAEQEERQIDPNYKPEYIPQEDYNATIVAGSSESSIEIDGATRPQTNQDYTTTSTIATPISEQQETMEGNTPINRCYELQHSDTRNFTQEQVKKFKDEMTEVCPPVVFDSPDEGAIELPRETEEGAESEYSLLRKILSFFTPEEKEEFKKNQGLGINFTKLEETDETVVQETTAKEPEKEESGGLIASFIAKIFSIFR